MASIIADGNHVNFEVIKMSHKLAKDRLFLITDAVASCNIGPYQHKLVGDKFVTTDGTLSGSNITMLQAVQNCVNHCDISLSDALKMASNIPASLIDRENLNGKIEIGFDAATAALIAAQTVNGAAELLLQKGTHPEQEIDKVTTPMGCTIAGLNEMEHQGFSSSLIRGITVSYKKIVKQ